MGYRKGMERIRNALNLPARKSYNSTLKCFVSDCPRNRKGVGRYCSRHEKARIRHGHPAGRQIPRHYYKRELSEVSAFLKRHSGHPALAAAEDWFEKWMSAASRGRNVPGREQMANLYEHGVTGSRLLLTVLALWLHSERFPRSVPADIRLTFALCNAALKLCPSIRTVQYTSPKGVRTWRYRKPGYHVREEIGRTIRRAMCVLYSNMLDAMKREEEARNRRLLALSKPFTSPGDQPNDAR